MRTFPMSPTLLAALGVVAMATDPTSNPNENPNVGVMGGALDQDTNATTPEAAGPPIDAPSREELRKSGYILPDHFYPEDQRSATGPTANTAATGPTSNTAAAGPTENKTDTQNTATGGTLDSVAFASPAARELAESENLTAADFGSVKPSGKDERYTVGDVQNVVDSRNQ